MAMKKDLKSIIDTKDENKIEEMLTQVCHTLKELKEDNKEDYEELKEKIYIIMYGYRLNDHLCEEWVKHMKNSDGTTGEHWTIAETTQVARQIGLTLGGTISEYEWWAVMNMIYSDYYGCVPNDISIYAKMGRSFLEDEDANEGKLYYYYKYIVSK